MRSAAILAGGRASRFGGTDKSALTFDGRTVLDRQREMLRGARDIHDIVLVGRAQSDHPGGDIRAIPDIVPGSGPLGGLHAALRELAPAPDAAMLALACDMPYVTSALVDFLFDCLHSEAADIVVPRTSRGYHPLCAVYTGACLPAVERRVAERRLKVTDLFADLRIRVVSEEELEHFGDHHRVLANVNTPVEYSAHKFQS